MEEVDDEDDDLPNCPLPSSASHILELSDGTDDDDCLPLIAREDKDDSDDDGDDDDEVDVPEESADVELGQ